MGHGRVASLSWVESWENYHVLCVKCKDLDKLTLPGSSVVV